MNRRGVAPSTSLTLLRRLKLASFDQIDAWPQFYSRYHRVLAGWCRSWGASREDAEDMAQESMLEIYRSLVSFDRQRVGSFRAWLRVVTLRAWGRQLRSRNRGASTQKCRPVENASVLSMVADTSQQMLVWADQIEDEELLRLGLDHVRGLISNQSWKVFEMSELQGIAIAAVAREMGCSPNGVRVNNCRIRKLLQDYVRRIA